MNFEVPQPSIEGSHPVHQELLNFSPEEERRLRSLTEKSRGVVRVFVHPFGQFLHEDKSKDEAYLKGIHRVVQEAKDKTAVIILVEHTEVSALHQELSEEWSDSIFLFQTYEGNPNLYDAENDSDEKSLLQLASFLSQNGAQKVLLGGAFLTFENEPDGLNVIEGRDQKQPINQFGRKGSYYLSSCVGDVANRFIEAGLEVKLSYFTVATDY